MTLNDARAVVEKGARFLDENEPGWVDKINLDELDMGNCTCCILGQVGDRPVGNRYEDYFDLLTRYRQQHGEFSPAQFGFDLWPYEPTVDGPHVYGRSAKLYRILKSAWTERIVYRRIGSLVPIGQR